MVERSRIGTGPYVDVSGTPMLARARSRPSERLLFFLPEDYTLNSQRLCVIAMANRADSRLAGRSVTGPRGAERLRSTPSTGSQLRPVFPHRSADLGIPSRLERIYVHHCTNHFAQQ